MLVIREPVIYIQFTTTKYSK